MADPGDLLPGAGIRAAVGERLHSLVYISAAVRALRKAEIAALLERARLRNRTLGITGLLLYSEGSFMQVLEGPLPAVEDTYARIERDARHRNLIRLSLEPIAEREFGDWDMAYDFASAPDFIALSESDWRARGAAGVDGRGRDLLRTFWAACRGER